VNVIGEIGLMFIGYNLTRCVSIFGTAELIKALRGCCLPDFTRITVIISSLYNEFLLPEIKIAV